MTVTTPSPVSPDTATIASGPVAMGHDEDWLVRDAEAVFLYIVTALGPTAFAVIADTLVDQQPMVATGLNQNDWSPLCSRHDQRTLAP